MPAGIRSDRALDRAARAPMRPAASARRCMRWSPDISPLNPGSRAFVRSLRGRQRGRPGGRRRRVPVPDREARSSRRSSRRPPPGRDGPDPAPDSRAPGADRPLPAGISLDRVRWRTLLPGIKPRSGSRRPAAARRRCTGSGPAAGCSPTTHEGCEYTLVLKGGVRRQRRPLPARRHRDRGSRDRSPAAGGRGRGLHLLHGHRRAPAADRTGRADPPRLFGAPRLDAAGSASLEP